MTLRWVIAGGGTGGHLTPALALGEVIRAQGDPVRFVGAKRGADARLVPAAGFELVTLDARPLVGRHALEQAGALLALARTTLAARRELGRFRADVVVSVGGYASVPTALAAWSKRVPVILVNTDASPGLANRLVGRFARRIFVGFEAAAARFRRSPDDDRVRVSGVPLREALRRTFADARRCTPRPPDGGDRTHLFVFGGSQGARQINDTVVAALPRLPREALRIVHQTGVADEERVREAYRAAGFEAEVLAFVHDMPARYLWADLVLCRAGALSIAELALAGRPALLVPLAHVGGGEQFANAQELERAGGALVLDSRALGPEELAEALAKLIEDGDRLRGMGERAASLARPEAADAIVGECRALLEGGQREGAA